MGEDEEASEPRTESASEPRVLPAPPGTLLPVRETEPVPHAEDAADDPAIWVHPTEPAKSLVIGTDKQGGLGVYDLSGKEIQFLPDGELDNVDLRSGFELDGRPATIVTAGDRSDNSIAVYRIDEPRRRLVNVAARVIHPSIETYGSCMYHSRARRKLFYFATSKSGHVEQWELFDGGGGEVDGRKVRTLSVEEITEGCVADDELARLYVSEEPRGIWRYGAEPTAGNARKLVDSTGSGGHLTADVEGLALSRSGRRGGYLIASSQGDNSFVVYQRGGDNRYVTTFRIRGGEGVDGVEDTDGIEVTTANLGPTFPTGLLVAQDGSNDTGHQNFKLVPWRTPGLGK